MALFDLRDDNEGSKLVYPGPIGMKWSFFVGGLFN